MYDMAQDYQDITPCPTPQTDAQRIHQLEAETARLRQRLSMLVADRDDLPDRVLAVEAAAVNAINVPGARSPRTSPCKKTDTSATVMAMAFAESCRLLFKISPSIIEHGILA